MRVKVMCKPCGEKILDAGALVIDDEDRTYRFTCPECKRAMSRRCPDPVRDVLRTLGVPTVDEVVLAASVVLEGDDQSIWDALDQAGRP